MTARIAPTNAAAPTTANAFLSSFFFAALPISAAQAMQTAAATSAMPKMCIRDSSYLVWTSKLVVFRSSLRYPTRTAAYGVSKNYHAAAVWYKKAADQGHKDAQYNLGVCYQNGQGVPRDKKRAADLFEQAAN